VSNCDNANTAAHFSPDLIPKKVQIMSKIDQYIGSYKPRAVAWGATNFACTLPRLNQEPLNQPMMAQTRFGNKRLDV